MFAPSIPNTPSNTSHPFFLNPFSQTPQKESDKSKDPSSGSLHFLPINIRKSPKYPLTNTTIFGELKNRTVKPAEYSSHHTLESFLNEVREAVLHSLEQNCAMAHVSRHFSLTGDSIQNLFFSETSPEKLNQLQLSLNLQSWDLGGEKTTREEFLTRVKDQLKNNYSTSLTKTSVEDSRLSCVFKVDTDEGEVSLHLFFTYINEKTEIHLPIGTDCDQLGPLSGRLKLELPERIEKEHCVEILGLITKGYSLADRSVLKQMQASLSRLSPDELYALIEEYCYTNTEAYAIISQLVFMDLYQGTKEVQGQLLKSLFSKVSGSIFLEKKLSPEVIKIIQTLANEKDLDDSILMGLIQLISLQSLDQEKGAVYADQLTTDQGWGLRLPLSEEGSSLLLPFTLSTRLEQIISSFLRFKKFNKLSKEIRQLSQALAIDCKAIDECPTLDLSAFSELLVNCQCLSNLCPNFEERLRRSLCHTDIDAWKNYAQLFPQQLLPLLIQRYSVLDGDDLVDLLIFCEEKAIEVAPIWEQFDPLFAQRYFFKRKIDSNEDDFKKWVFEKDGQARLLTLLVCPDTGPYLIPNGTQFFKELDLLNVLEMDTPIHKIYAERLFQFRQSQKKIPEEKLVKAILHYFPEEKRTIAKDSFLKKEKALNLESNPSKQEIKKTLNSLIALVEALPSLESPDEQEQLGRFVRRLATTYPRGFYKLLNEAQSHKLLPPLQDLSFSRLKPFIHECPGDRREEHQAFLNGLILKLFPTLEDALKQFPNGFNEKQRPRWNQLLPVLKPPVDATVQYLLDKTAIRIHDWKSFSPAAIEKPGTFLGELNKEEAFAWLQTALQDLKNDELKSLWPTIAACTLNFIQHYQLKSLTRSNWELLLSRRPKQLQSQVFDTALCKKDQLNDDTIALFYSIFIKRSLFTEALKWKKEKIEPQSLGNRLKLVNQLIATPQLEEARQLLKLFVNTLFDQRKKKKSENTKLNDPLTLAHQLITNLQSKKSPEFQLITDFQSKESPELLKYLVSTSFGQWKNGKLLPTNLSDRLEIIHSLIIRFQSKEAQQLLDLLLPTLFDKHGKPHELAVNYFIRKENSSKLLQKLTSQQKRAWYLAYVEKVSQSESEIKVDVNSITTLEFDKNLDFWSKLLILAKDSKSSVFKQDFVDLVVRLYSKGERPFFNKDPSQEADEELLRSWLNLTEMRHSRETIDLILSGDTAEKIINDLFNQSHGEDLPGPKLTIAKVSYKALPFFIDSLLKPLRPENSEDLKSTAEKLIENINGFLSMDEDFLLKIIDLYFLSEKTENILYAITTAFTQLVLQKDKKISERHILQKLTESISLIKNRLPLEGIIENIIISKSEINKVSLLYEKLLIYLFIKKIEDLKKANNEKEIEKIFESITIKNRFNSIIGTSDYQLMIDLIELSFYVDFDEFFLHIANLHIDYFENDLFNINHHIVNKRLGDLFVEKIDSMGLSRYISHYIEIAEKHPDCFSDSKEKMPNSLKYKKSILKKAAKYLTEKINSYKKEEINSLAKQIKLQLQKTYFSPEDNLIFTKNITQIFLRAEDEDLFLLVADFTLKILDSSFSKYEKLNFFEAVMKSIQSIENLEITKKESIYPLIEVRNVLPNSSILDSINKEFEDCLKSILEGKKGLRLSPDIISKVTEKVNRPVYSYHVYQT